MVLKGFMEHPQEEVGNTIKRLAGYTGSEDSSPKLLLYLEGQQLDRTLTLYQAITEQQFKFENDCIPSAKFWNQVYKITYARPANLNRECPKECNYQVHDSFSCAVSESCLEQPLFFSNILFGELVSLIQSSPTYDVLYLLKSLEGMNRFRFHMMSRERIYAFAKGRSGVNLENLKVAVPGVPQNEFVSSKVTEKLEQQMQDALAVSVGGLPFWCTQLMASCPFLFGFETKCKYFRLAAFSQQPVKPLISRRDDVGGLNSSRQSSSTNPRKKFLVHRDRILDSATQMMNLHAHQKVVLEVEYDEEVGTGLGPTLEFYTLVCHEFQKSGLGLWREDHAVVGCIKSLEAEGSRNLVAPFGLFPCPWSQKVKVLNGIEFSEVANKFVLLGQIVAKALQDGRVLDLPFSKAFYKLILGKVNSIFIITIYIAFVFVCS